MPNASGWFNNGTWDQHPARVAPRILDYTVSWIPIRVTSGKWVWNRKVYIEQLINSKYLYFDEEDFFLETLSSEKPVEVGHKVHILFNNRYMPIVYLPIALPAFFITIILVAVFFGWKDFR